MGGATRDVTTGQSEHARPLCCAGCTNSVTIGISVFKFPKNEDLRKKWIAQVRRTRDKWNGPTSNSAVVCSDHFTADCFEDSTLRQSFGIKVKSPMQCLLSYSSILSRTALEKRIKNEVSFNKQVW